MFLGAPACVRGGGKWVRKWGEHHYLKYFFVILISILIKVVQITSQKISQSNLLGEDDQGKAGVTEVQLGFSTKTLTAIASHRSKMKLATFGKWLMLLETVVPTVVAIIKAILPESWLETKQWGGKYVVARLLNAVTQPLWQQKYHSLCWKQTNWKVVIHLIKRQKQLHNYQPLQNWILWWLQYDKCSKCVKKLKVFKLGFGMHCLLCIKSEKCLELIIESWKNLYHM